MRRLGSDRVRIRREDVEMPGDTDCTDRKPRRRSFLYIDEAAGSTDWIFGYCGGRSRIPHLI